MALNLYSVVRDGDGDGWAVEKDGERIGHYNLQVEAEAAAQEMARNDREDGSDRDRGHSAPHIAH